MKFTCLTFWLTAVNCTAASTCTTATRAKSKNYCAFVTSKNYNRLNRKKQQNKYITVVDNTGTNFYSKKFFEDAQDLIQSSSRGGPNTARLMSTVSQPPPASSESSSSASSSGGGGMPELGEDGVYHISNKEQHINFVEANSDKLIVVKFYAPWCRACKGLEPKYLKMVHDIKYADIPLVWADLSIQHNKEYVKELGVLALPSIQITAGSDGLVENFPCGPSKVPILKKKLHQLINDRINPDTLTLKLLSEAEEEAECETPPCDELAITQASCDTDVNGAATTTTPTTATSPSSSETTPQLSVAGTTVSEEQMKYLRYGIPFFKDFTDDEFDTMLSKAKLVTFDSGSIIMRQGMPGRMFYVIEEGEVEISVRTGLEDPMTTQASYLGTVLNHLGPSNYFGERSMITGEPRAASIRAIETTKCFAFDIDDIPPSSILSGKKQAVTDERIQQVNDKYGVDVYTLEAIIEESTTKKANIESQKRGSVFKPNKDARPTFSENAVDDDVSGSSSGSDVIGRSTYNTIPTKDQGTSIADDVLPLLVKFQMIRRAARCFDYIMHTKPKWGDEGESRRRQMLVAKLSPAQQSEFTDVFKMIDTSGDGLINLAELKRALITTGNQDISDEEISDMINKADPSVDGNAEITYQDFMGVMAEAEFYHLFRDTFSSLDKYDSGFVRASDLDRVLCGVRDLISDDRKSIIDVEDKEMMIDYDHFSKMLLGTGFEGL